MRKKQLLLRRNRRRERLRIRRKIKCMALARNTKHYHYRKLDRGYFGHERANKAGFLEALLSFMIASRLRQGTQHVHQDK